MRKPTAILWLVPLIAVLALAAAAAGLLTRGGSAFSFTTPRGESVSIYGQGLYRYDTPLAALSFKGADIVTLVLAIPALIAGLVFYRRGSLRGGLLLAGAVGYFLYNYGSMAFGAAYNNLFLVYVALLAASLFAFVIVLTSFDLAALPARFAARLPRQAIGIFLIVSGVIPAAVWLVLSIVPALLRGEAPPEVASYTTFMTGVVDVGIIAPALIVAGVLLLRRSPAGYLLASTLLVFTAILGPAIIAGSILQLATGTITIGQAMGFSVPFAILTLVDIDLTVVLMRSISAAPAARQAKARRRPRRR